MKINKNFLFFLIFTISISDSYSQKWIPCTKGLNFPPQAGIVFNDNIYVIERSDSADALLLMGDTGYTEVARLTTNTPNWKLEKGKEEIYLVQKYYDSKDDAAIFSFNGKRLKDISPTDSVLSFGSSIVFNEKLFVNVDLKKSNLPFVSEWDGKTFTKNSSTRFIILWDGQKWSKQDLKTDITEKGNFFIFKNILYYEVITSSEELLIFRLEANEWTLVLKNKTDLYSSLSIVEFNSLAYFFDGSNGTYFTFDGIKLKKQKWDLEFDNYGSSEFFLLSFDSKLFLAGRFWCNVKDAKDVICFDGNNWKATGPGLEGDMSEPQISVFLKHKGTLYAFGDFGDTEKGFNHSAKFTK